MSLKDIPELCLFCKKKTIDYEKGTLCGLTNDTPSFSEYCHNYEEDQDLRKEVIANKYPVKKSFKEASQGKRLGNFLIDIVFYWIFSFVFGMGLGVVISFINPEATAIFEEDNKLIQYLFGFIAGMIYYTFMEATTGKTMGKFFTKTRVINEYGQRPDILTLLSRSFFRFIPLEIFSFLGSNTGWHDSFSKTRVVED